MKKGVILCSLAFLSAPLLALAGTNPDFDEDATPILRMQPGLLNYVHSHFEVKETGRAKYPGDDDRRPAPPYIFRARAAGSEGPYNIRLLIQPGPAGRILCVVPPGTTAPSQKPPPEIAQRPQPQEAQPTYQSPTLSQGEVKPLPAQNSAPSEPTSDTPSGPTADTPSGPIMPNSSSTGSANPQQNLAPPPDPAPSGQ